MEHVSFSNQTTVHVEAALKMSSKDAAIYVGTGFVAGDAAIISVAIYQRLASSEVDHDQLWLSNYLAFLRDVAEMEG